MEAELRTGILKPVDQLVDFGTLVVGLRAIAELGMTKHAALFARHLDAVDPAETIPGNFSVVTVGAALSTLSTRDSMELSLPSESAA